MGECPKCAIVQLYTWCLFMGMLMVSWDGVMPKVIEKMMDAASVAKGNGDPFRRTYLVALMAYALVMLCFELLFYLMLLYVACTLAAMSARYAIPAMLGKVILWLANPTSVFHFIQTEHVPFHAVAIGCAFLGAFGSLMFYVTDADLQLDRDPQAVRNKFARVLFATAAILIVGYGAYMLYCAFTAAMW